MSNFIRNIMIISLFVLLLSGCTRQSARVAADSHSEKDNTAIQETSEGVKYLVHPTKIRSGGPPPDGIPPIDEPRFVSVKEANRWIADSELVMAFDYKGVSRVYPIQVMVWHEIVNDTVAGDPILITWCPLCGSGIAYERQIDGEAVEFGTSGKLYNSNLVMYDRKSGTLWTQISGEAVYGELTGRRLTPVSIDVVVWRDWKKRYPDSEVLSRETGFTRDYGRDPYGSYYTDPGLFFPVENYSDKIHPKTVVFGIEVEGVYKAYRESDLVERGRIEDTVSGVRILLERDAAGIVTVTNRGGIIVKERDFWFVWYAFHPTTLLYGN